MGHATSQRPSWGGLAGLAGAIGLALWHQAILVRWVVEDAAIAYAFARNLATGEGLVAFPGGPRVEGYSDPLWVAILAGFHALGADLFVVADVLGMVFTAATVVAVWALGRACGGREPSFALLAAFLLALSPQQAIWATSGLENPLMNLLMALCALAVCREAAKTGAFPWSAVAALGLALTRPEGVVYAAVVFGVVAVFRLRPAIWAATFAVPFMATHAVRYAYFAWPMPMTYYAKLGEQTFAPFDVGSHGFTYLKTYAEAAALWWLFPWLVLGLVGPSLPGGPSRWRTGIGIGAVLALGALPWLPQSATPVVVWGALALVPLLAWGRPGVLVLGGFGAVAVAFALRANGDWMSGWRWLAAAAVPASVLGAAGLAAAFTRVTQGSTARRVLVLAAVAALSLHTWRSAAMTWAFAKDLPVSPFDVRYRIEHLRTVAALLQLHRPITHLDVDLGGAMWWGPPDVWTTDAYGLVDIPFAQNKGREGFVEEYVYEQLRPDTMFVAGRANHARFSPRFDRMYVPTRQSDVAVGRGEVLYFVRRELLFADHWPGPIVRTEFGTGPTLEGFRIVAPEVDHAGGVHLEVGVRRRSDEGFTLLAFLSTRDELVATYAWEPAYGWVAPADWRNDEVWHARFALPIPDSAPVGPLDLGFVMLGADGTPIAPTALPQGAQADQPRFAHGEVRFAGVVEIVTREQAEAFANSDAGEVRRLASSGDCAGAEAAWFDGLAHGIRKGDWRDRFTASLAEPLATCWAHQAGKEDKWKPQLDALARGRRWNPTHPALVAVGKQLARDYNDKGAAARAQGNVKGWFHWYDAAARADPTDVWARREAETARKQRLTGALD